ncbi:hypothetical protein GCM10027280_28460 [Micromonospora polyrhachis]|uniref:Tetratricopeptide (TPR) repeat protein n=1 Tax=Micromonospora polyrhachis TaxID=1282883 RepID=A0A7W7SQP8_9ACTN|nr:hypothetical protein [Micromonospora polyrhachis]MBB4959173.1 tetratricopeptide (TPR) repeat protein [Micromonospora polyrhachis]
MTSSHDDLWRQFRHAANMPYGAGQIATVEQLIRQADAAGDEEMAFAARMLGTNAYVYGGEPVKSFVTFSWCLADFDRKPRPYHQQYLHNLLWHFKYMVNALLNFPEVPLDRTYAVLDDMERRYRAGGHSPQAVYKYRHRVARHLGDVEQAEEWYRKWITTPRDDLSDCAGCDPSAQAAYLAENGRDEEAIALAEPVLAGRLSCTEQPQGILVSLLLPYLRTGRRDAARDAHQRAYRAVRGNLADLWDIGEHVEFCGLTGNDARGLEIVERHLDWLDRAPSPAAAMAFASTAVPVLRRLDQAGHGELTAHRRAYGDRPAADVPVGVLADELARVATEIAARFDARNGTTSQSAGATDRMATEPIGEHLPLSATARRQTARSTPAEAGTSADQTAAPAESTSLTEIFEPFMMRVLTAVALPEDATPEQLLDQAEELWRTERIEDVVAVVRAFDERFGEAELPPRTVARRAEFRAVECGVTDDLTGAAEANRQAVVGYQELPDPVREQIVAGRLGVLLCQTGAEDEGLLLVTESAAYLAEHGTPAERASAYDRLAVALFTQERWSEAATAIESAVEAASEVDDSYLSARITLRRAVCFQALEQRTESSQAAAEARDHYRALGLPDGFAAACICYAQSLDDPAEVVAALDEALHVPADEAALPARTGRARALLAADRPAEAVDDFVEAVALCAERGIADGAAYLRWELANAYQQAGQLLDAAEAAEEAVSELTKLGYQADADRCRHLLANVYLSLGETDLALGLFDQLAENLDGPDNLGPRGEVLEEAGDLLYRTDRDSVAAQRFAAAAEAYRLGGLPLDEVRARRREMDALNWAGSADAALAAIERADRAATGLSAEVASEPAAVWEQSMVAAAGARVLFNVDRAEEGLARLDGVPERLREIEAFGEATQVELLVGEGLLRLDRPAEAEPILRRTVAGLPAGSGVVRQAAWLLSQALVALGRNEEAEALRAEHDLDTDE